MVAVGAEAWGRRWQSPGRPPLVVSVAALAYIALAAISVAVLTLQGRRPAVETALAVCATGP